MIGDAFNLARGSLLDYAVALNMTTYMHSEVSYVPWKAFLDALEFIRGMLSKQSAYVLLEVSILPNLNFNLFLPVSSADKFCKQFDARSGPTKDQA